MTVTITFLGAAGTVTGSKYLVESNKKKILIDAGLFQGKREWRVRNWTTPDFDLRDVSAVVLTHAHIDHTGMLPRYHSMGLTCPVYCSRSTKELIKILLPDSGRLQEENSEYRRTEGRSRHNPPLPLYTEDDALKCLEKVSEIQFGKRIEILPSVYVTLSHMGHILGAAAVTLEIGEKRIVFSGDVGRYNVPILKDPEPVKFGDLLLIESTYGNRLHPEISPKLDMERVINETYQRRGVVVIPSFAVGRTQLILFYLRELKNEQKIPDIPIVIDSPMACDATEIYRNNPTDYDQETLGIFKSNGAPFTPQKLAFCRKRSDSIRLNSLDEPMIIISASGMLNGGRILHHLQHRVSDPKNSILFVGYQPPGGRGAWMQSGAQTMRIFGHEVPIRAKINSISGLSAHADRGELLTWCRACSETPGSVAIVHGEPDSADDFKSTLTKELNWNPFVAKYLETYTV